MNYKAITLCMLAGLSSLGGCGGGSGGNSTIEEPAPGNPNQGESTLTYRTGFPSGMLVASPTSSVSSSPAPSPSKLAHSKTIGKPSTAISATTYESLNDQIEDLLSGAADLDDVFDPNAFFAIGSDAECYGPQLLFEDHPDASGGADDGTLPTGDLGIWVETDTTGEVCAAAQLNAQLSGIEQRISMSMMGLASLILAYEYDGNVWPDDIQSSGSSGDLSSLLNTAGLSGITFAYAGIEYDSVSEQYSYELSFSYNRDGTDYDAFISLIYDPAGDEDDDTYESLLNLLVEDTFVNPSDDCSDEQVTRNNSLHFVSLSDSDVRLQNREALLCGHFDQTLTSASNGLTVSLTDMEYSELIEGMILNPDVDPDGSSLTLDGWQNDFSYFTAEFDPETLQGDYAYVWQAGPGDSHSRIMNLGLEVTGGDVGEAYFGYGDQVDSTEFSNVVEGFICNWAGPGATHSLLEHAQRQHITRNEESGMFEPSNDNGSSSNITYAPTNSCEYDGSGTFLYDRDLDSDLGDETADTVNIGPGQTLELDLVSDSSNTYDGISDYIINGRGYDLPEYPVQ